jgi:hypothetical protein
VRLLSLGDVAGDFSQTISRPSSSRIASSTTSAQTERHFAHSPALGRKMACLPRGCQCL